MEPMITEATLHGWEQLAVRANAPTPNPSGYQAALEEDARRMIRTQLVRDAVPALLAEVAYLRDLLGVQRSADNADEDEIRLPRLYLARVERIREMANKVHALFLKTDSDAFVEAVADLGGALAECTPSAKTDTTWRCACGAAVDAPDPRCEDEVLCRACADELSAAEEP